MTTTPADERREAFVHTLRRIADLTEAGVLPTPITDVMVSWWFDERTGGRQAAAVAAESLAVDWTPERAGTTGDRTFLLAHAKPRPAPVHLSLFLKLADELPVPEVPQPAVEFAAQLTQAAGGAQ